MVTKAHPTFLIVSTMIRYPGLVGPKVLQGVRAYSKHTRPSHGACKCPTRFAMLYHVFAAHGKVGDGFNTKVSLVPPLAYWRAKFTDSLCLRYEYLWWQGNRYTNVKHANFRSLFCYLNRSVHLQLQNQSLTSYLQWPKHCSRGPRRDEVYVKRRSLV